MEEEQTMPRISTLTFTKPHDMVVEAFKGMVKDPSITVTQDGDIATTYIEGEYSTFVLEDMDMWGGYLRFEIRDNRVMGEDDREARAILSEQMPGFGAVLFSPTIALVFRRVEVTTRTKTITEQMKDGKVSNHTESEWQESTEYEWENITREFGQKVPPR
jgi:hypothetical protein